MSLLEFKEDKHEAGTGSQPIQPYVSFDNHAVQSHLLGKREEPENNKPFQIDHLPNRDDLCLSI